MTTKHLLKCISLLCLTLVATVACKKDKEPNQKHEKGDLAVISMLTNPEGTSGTSWLQLIDGITPKTIDNKQAQQVCFGVPPLPVYGNWIITMPDYGTSNTVQKWIREDDGSLKKAEALTLPTNTFASHGIIASKEKGYLCTANGKVLTFNPQNMTLLGEIDLTPYSLVNGYIPFAGSPFIDGSHMYLPLWHVNESRMPNVDPMIDILLFDVKTDKVIKRLQENKSGLAHAGYASGEDKCAFKDEKGDVYFVTCGAFSMNPKYKTGILRIKKGTEEIDPSYNWVLNEQTIEGEAGKTRWLAVIHYLGNGKLYGMMDIPERWQNPDMPNFARDRSYIAVEIDIYNKTVKKLPIPETCAYAAHVSPYDDKLLFAVWGDKDSGFYSYDPKTGKASNEAVIKVPGFAYWCHQFK